MYIEKDVTLESGNYNLPATLTLPKKGAHWPVVLLIQDEGPFDKDETRGPNKPMRDIAIGLAQNGVASFRWDKRGYAYKNDIKEHGEVLSANDQIIADAISAIYYVRTLDYINHSKVFLAGHAMGGYMTPMIAKHAPFLGGIVIMGANALPYGTVLHNRLMHLNMHRNAPDSAEALDSLDAQLKAVLHDKIPVGTPATQIPGGLTLSFWQQISNYSPAYTAAELNMPIFIMGGTRDYEAPTEDMDKWKSALRRHRDVKIKTYPVNHELQPGKTDVGYDEEYTQPNHVPYYYISDIADWVKHTH